MPTKSRVKKATHKKSMATPVGDFGDDVLEAAFKIAKKHGLDEFSALHRAFHEFAKVIGANWGTDRMIRISCRLADIVDSEIEEGRGLVCDDCAADGH